MDPDVLKRFELMERAHQRAMERMDRAEELAAQRDAKHDRDFKKAMERMDKHDRQLEVTAKLIRAGMVFVGKLGKEVRELGKEVRELKKSQEAFLDSLRGGNGHRNSNGRKGRKNGNGNAHRT